MHKQYPVLTSETDNEKSKGMTGCSKSWFHVCNFQLIFLFQAGMIKTEQEEFFIEPLERGDGVIEKEEDKAGGGRTHIVYRSSAVKKVPISSAAADYHSRGWSVVLIVLSSTFNASLTESCSCTLQHRFLISISP